MGGRGMVHSSSDGGLLHKTLEYTVSHHVKSTDKYRTDDGTVHEVLWIGRHDEHCATDTHRIIL